MANLDSFPDAAAYQWIDDGFDALIEWLDAHPDGDVTAFAGWRDVPSSPDPSPDSTMPP